MPDGKFVKTADPLRNDCLNRHLYENVIGRPFVIKERAIFGRFEGISSQIKNFRNAKVRKILSPQLQPLGALFEEYDFQF